MRREEKICVHEFRYIVSLSIPHNNERGVYTKSESVCKKCGFVYEPPKLPPPKQRIYSWDEPLPEPRETKIIYDEQEQQEPQLEEIELTERELNDNLQLGDYEQTDEKEVVDIIDVIKYGTEQTKSYQDYGSEEEEPPIEDTASKWDSLALETNTKFLGPEYICEICYKTFRSKETEPICPECDGKKPYIKKITVGISEMSDPELWIVMKVQAGRLFTDNWQTSYLKGRRKARPCQKCGKPVIYKTKPFKYCEDCKK